MKIVINNLDGPHLELHSETHAEEYQLDGLAKDLELECEPGYDGTGYLLAVPMREVKP